MSIIDISSCCAAVKPAHRRAASSQAAAAPAPSPPRRNAATPKGPLYIPPMKTLPCLLALTFSADLCVAAAPPPAEDPFIWLEEPHGERAMNWVKAENVKTDAVLERDTRFKALFHDAKAILEAKDRIPEPSIIGAQIFNFWQDADHAHGIWRQTSRTDFQSAVPNWRTVIDLDALSKSESANWFWKGANCHEPEEQRCIINLS